MHPFERSGNDLQLVATDPTVGLSAKISLRERLKDRFRLLGGPFPPLLEEISSD